MEPSRREFTAMTGAALAAASAGGAVQAAPVRYPPDAWHQRMKRIVHVNFNERDPEGFDVAAWADHLTACKAQATYLSGTNVCAFYPTALPDLPVSRWLNGRDLFGECVAAAKQRGIRVIARFSLDIAQAALAARRPEWFCRTQDGALVRRSLVGAPNDPSASSEYAPTCQFTSYYDEFAPALFAEVLRRYDVDGLYSNGWPGVDVVICYCATCARIGDPHSEGYRRAYQARAVELWRHYAAQAAAKDRRLVFTGNLGGGFRGGDLDLSTLAADAPWFMADNQGRGRVGEPAWDSSQQTRIGRAIMDGRPVTNLTAAYEIAGDIRWRNVTGNAAEVRSRLYQTLAAGGAMHHHWLGFHQGFVEDRRWQAVAREVLGWQAANDAHFHNRRSLADVALVVSQRSNRLYRPPPGTDALDALQGMYQLLIEARVPFDVVLERDLPDLARRPYRLVVLANVALMSDAEAAGVVAFARRGGSVLSTFETGLYDEAGRLRPDFALAALFGMRSTGKRESFGVAVSQGHGAFPGSSSQQRIESAHPILASFRDTNWIQGSSCRVPIAIDGAPLLTHVPQYPWYPTEGVYPRTPRTPFPTVAVREVGGSRRVHLAGDIDAGYWRSGAADLGDLIGGALSWLAPGMPPVEVQGQGLVEVHGWETEAGLAVHLVNHTAPSFRGGAMRQPCPAGEQQVALTLEEGRAVRAVRLLMDGTGVPFAQDGAAVRFTVPGLRLYEVAVIEIA